MTTQNKIIFSILGFFAFVFVSFFGTMGAAYIHYYNYGNTTEKTLEADYSQSQNVLATYTTKIGEMAQVPTMYHDQLESLVKTAIQSRYGDQGSKATFQFLKEQNPTLDSKMYSQLMDVMESGRNDFQNSQTMLIDTRRAYETTLGNFFSGFMLKLAGYPKVDLKKYDPVINDHTEKAFTTKRDEGVNILKPATASSK